MSKVLKRLAEGLKLELSQQKLGAYARLGRYSQQTGTKLLFWPCAWGLALGVPSPLMLPALAGGLAVFYFGAFNLRTMGCVANDFLDRDFDRQVQRCQSRPLASGELGGADAAKLFLAHGLGGLATLSLLAPAAVAQSLLVFPVAMAYPLAKRHTHFAQVVLGGCFNIGVFIGFAQATGAGVLLPLLPFYLGGVLWTVIYDTVYALQDRTDDSKLGLKGMALLWGSRSKVYAKRANLGMLLSFLFGGHLFDLNLLFSLGMLANYLNTNSAISKVDLRRPQDFMRFFNQNARVGLLIFLLILFGRIGADSSRQQQARPELTQQSTDTKTL